MPDVVRHLRRGREEGFTLVEMLVVVVILGVVGAVFASTVIQATRVDDRTRTRADAQYTVSLGLDRLTEEVRVAAPLVSVSATQLVVDTYPNQPAGGSLRERHTFALTGGQLTQTVQSFSPSTSTTATSTSTRVLTDSLDLSCPAVGDCASFFRGRDRAGSLSTSAAKVASVEVKLSRTTQTTRPVDATTTIFLRNYQG